MERGKWKLKAATAVLAIGASFGVNHLIPLPGETVHSFEAPPKVEVMTIQDLRDGMTIPHFAKIAGIAEQFRDDGVDIPANLDLRLRYAERISEMKYAQYEGVEDYQIAFDMAHSEGALEAREGDWTVGTLKTYVDKVMELDERFLEVAEAASAYLKDEGMSADDADFYVRQTIGLSYFDHTQDQGNTLTGSDSRVQIRDEADASVVMDLHVRMHGFFQHRLNQLDLADHEAIVGFDLSNLVEASSPKASYEDEAPGMDM